MEPRRPVQELGLELGFEKGGGKGGGGMTAIVFLSVKQDVVCSVGEWGYGCVWIFFVLEIEAMKVKALRLSVCQAKEAKRNLKPKRLDRHEETKKERRS